MASIIVTGVLMTVNSECSVAISYLSEGKWLSLTQPCTPKFFLLINLPLYKCCCNWSSFGCLVIAVMITVIVIIEGVLKNCSGGMAIENTENYVATFTYYHHFKHTHMHSSFQNVAIYIKYSS